MGKGVNITIVFINIIITINMVCDREAGFYAGQMSVKDSFVWNPF